MKSLPHELLELIAPFGACGAPDSAAIYGPVSPKSSLPGIMTAVGCIRPALTKFSVWCILFLFRDFRLWVFHGKAGTVGAEPGTILSGGIFQSLAPVWDRVPLKCLVLAILGLQETQSRARTGCSLLGRF